MLLKQWEAMLPPVATLQPSQRATVMSASHVFVIHGIIGTITHRQAKWSIWFWTGNGYSNVPLLMQVLRLHPIAALSCPSNVRSCLIPVLKVGDYMVVYDWQVFESWKAKWETKTNFVNSNRCVLALMIWSVAIWVNQANPRVCSCLRYHVVLTLSTNILDKTSWLRILWLV